MLYPNGTTRRPAVSSPFGPRDGGAFSFHYGADLIGFRTIRAVAAGRVTFAGWMNNAAGYTVAIDHGGGVTSVYMHNASHHVRRGEHVTEGQPIAVMGDSGNATGPCNHLEIRVRGRSVEPLGYIAAQLTAPAPTGNPTSPNPANPATNPNHQEEEMTATYINVKGTPNERRGGCYAIMRDNNGDLFARFVSPAPLVAAPTIAGARELREWDKTLPGLR